LSKPGFVVEEKVGTSPGLSQKAETVANPEIAREKSRIIVTSGGLRDPAEK
jgi:hypothetical protein